jgi:hypothetical protein
MVASGRGRGGVDRAAVMATQQGPSDSDDRLDSVAVTTGQRGPGSGDDREDGTVHGRGSDDDGGGSSQGDGSVVLAVEEERDGTVPGHGGEGWADDAVPGRGDSMETFKVAAASKSSG